MTPDELKLVKQEVLAMGERTRGFLHVELTHDGKFTWRYGGSIPDAVFMLWVLDQKVKAQHEKGE